uniref:Uncharacterized protein n=1 Tax=Aplanochytrium stocchinoi TaxID=215587 RepID=A0A6S8E9G0_9STRA|mmetsp:Transcript_5309/g.6690  ORF Transcript_5309/g.6690 Transcript_5309/m.6690 type:complete len:312 (+) Transcript_5309:29-964(+)|eukprot:CAMPEP_0204837176 /NCGR_PEP_ID=MMETSP1346-20131115/27275_1 /ASSEMBLY_ACC=CAM_ASM_000771 /TAXON_ID=215587 /ORGANISM="Aplanochytrium stocchinoi, Strain GSBS06" /LENGTH=311 /DNA_ID=CAMNT_0051972467 /DNA_START=75 /DNA_END=1010 /DNA_ORIENTATION=+
MPKASNNTTLTPFRLPPHRRGSSNRLGSQNSINYKKKRKQSLAALLSNVNVNVNNIKGGLKIFQKRNESSKQTGSDNNQIDLVPERSFKLGKLTRDLPRRDLHSLDFTLDERHFEYNSDDGEECLEEDDIPPPYPNPSVYSGNFEKHASNAVIKAPKPLHPHTSHGEEPVFRTFFVSAEEKKEIENESNFMEYSSALSTPTLPRRKRAGKVTLIPNYHPDLKQVPYYSPELERYKRMQISRLSRKLTIQEMKRDGYNPSSLFGANWENEIHHQWKNPWVKIPKTQDNTYFWSNINTGETLEEEVFDEEMDI